jgi:hypothetical protein
LAEQDERVRVSTEVLQGIRVVKMQAWEMPLLERIRVARRLELSKLGTAPVLARHHTHALDKSRSASIVQSLPITR